MFNNWKWVTFYWYKFKSICILLYDVSSKLFIYLIPYISEQTPAPESNPCIPSPCGPNSLCQAVNKSPICTCMENYFGSPPNCRAECTVNSDCSSNTACINQRCRDPCPGSCGLQTECQVFQHSAICSCREGYTGNPFQSCYIKEQIGELTNLTIFFFDILDQLRIHRLYKNLDSRHVYGA